MTTAALAMVLVRVAAIARASAFFLVGATAAASAFAIVFGDPTVATAVATTVAATVAAAAAFVVVVATAVAAANEFTVHFLYSQCFDLFCRQPQCKAIQIQAIDPIAHKRAKLAILDEPRSAYIHDRADRFLGDRCRCVAYQ